MRVNSNEIHLQVRRRVQTQQPVNLVEARSHYTSEPRLNDTETPPQRRRGSQRRPQTQGEYQFCLSVLLISREGIVKCLGLEYLISFDLSEGAPGKCSKYPDQLLISMRYRSLHLFHRWSVCDYSEWVYNQNRYRLVSYRPNGNASEIHIIL